MATWMIISGSPYAQGKCTTVAKRVADELRITGIADKVLFFSCDALRVAGCIGCDRCKESFSCIYHDDQHLIEEALEHADALLVISPIYFAGVPSQLKAILDRFQPYYWKRRFQIEEGLPRPDKRPLCVALVGEGGDPYGDEPVLPSILSPLALADFMLCYHHAFIRSDVEELFTKLTSDLAEATKDLLS